MGLDWPRGEGLVLDEGESGMEFKRGWLSHCIPSRLFPLTLSPLSPHDASFYIPENRLNFPITKGFRTKISIQLVYQYMAIFFNF